MTWGEYNKVAPERRRVLDAFDPDDDRGRKIKLIPVWEKYMNQHPAFAC